MSAPYLNPAIDRNHETVIEIDGLTKDYEVGFLKKKSVRALDGLTLEVRKGEIFGFLGPNGAGKTTTLKLLMRLIYPTSGSAMILGRPIQKAETRARIGYLPENPYFYDYLSGRELLKYTASLFGASKERAGRKAEELLEQVGLADARADRQLRKYSKGMLQRIGIAQALVNDPEVIFMDEPMSGLDPVGRREVRDLLLSLRRQNKTIFFSSHILSDVEALCDRAAILQKGKLIGCGTVEELTEDKASALEIVAVGLDESAFALLAGTSDLFLSTTATPNGVQLVIDDESRVGETLAMIHRFGGKLVSINPKRKSLEDLFSRAEQKD
ncbi:MAG TPA: ABC transporter ATP-binding protein [Blastocatellia bacterium]|jgi:ABC-2 type transport system ATP-binding protein|nr:ABC transporter ATP-binding protein [Blastocatellia bacterium]